MASSFLKGLVTDYGKFGYQLWHRPLKMASLVYEREIGADDIEQLACVAGGMRERASEEFASGEVDSSPILSRLRHSRSRLRYQNKSIRARNPASYAGYRTTGRRITCFSFYLRRTNLQSIIRGEGRPV